MHPLSSERPKALMPTLDVPQLAWALAGLPAVGVELAWVNQSSSAEHIEEEARKAGERLGLKVQISQEAEGPLGTAGALRKLAAELTETFLVLNADVAGNVDLRMLIEAHRHSGGAATLVVVPTDNGADLVAEHGWVVDLVDRRDRTGRGHIYAGIGAFEPEVLAYVPDGVSGLFETVMMGLLRDRQGLAVVEWSGYWLDVGNPAAHLRANLDALSGALPAADIVQSMGDGFERWDRLAYVGNGARVEGAELRYGVVGRGARLAPGTYLERSVVWDGATVPRGFYRDAVLTPRRVLPIRRAAWFRRGPST